MENIKVLLCCGAGLSSGFLAQRARKSAKKRNLDIKIEAKSETEAILHLKKIDILLLAPHYEIHRVSKTIRCRSRGNSTKCLWNFGW